MSDKITKQTAVSAQNSGRGNDVKKMTAISLAFMAITGVWNFGNIINGYGKLNGTHVIIPWLCVFILYFLPYSLMVGEMGSVFKKETGGVSAWVQKTIGPKIAFFAGWIYWVVHIPYLAQKSNNLVVAFNWLFKQSGDMSNFSTIVIQIMAVVVVLVCILIATRGTSVISKIGSIAGIAMFIMMILYIIMVFTAPAITGRELVQHNYTIDSFLPKDWSVINNMSIIILGVGGCEKLAPYVKDMKNPGKGFPLGMLLLVIMVVITATLGALAMDCMYDMNNLPEDFIRNGQFQAFAILGEWYGVGNLFMTMYSISWILVLLGGIIISIDAPLKIMLGNADEKYIPKWLMKKNKKGAYTNGMIVVGIAVTIISLVPCIGMDNVDTLVNWLLKVNSVSMPIRYLFVFIGYIGLKRAADKFENNDYTFVKSKGFGIFIGMWCLVITAACCIMGMYDKDPFQFMMNVLTPLVLIGAGFILPLIAKKTNK